ncbi:hypothetical protein ACV7JQ_07060 [Globicatella sulfidifaciens]
MSYKVIRNFSDLNDRSAKEPNGHFYTVGKKYPREGYIPTKQRIQSLTTTKNTCGEVFIEEIKVTKPRVKKSRVGDVDGRTDE